MDDKNTTISSSSNRFFRYLKEMGFRKGGNDFFEYDRAQDVLPETSEPSRYTKMIRWTATFLGV